MIRWIRNAPSPQYFWLFFDPGDLFTCLDKFDFSIACQSKNNTCKSVYTCNSLMTLPSQRYVVISTDPNVLVCSSQNPIVLRLACLIKWIDIDPHFPVTCLQMNFMDCLYSSPLSIVCQFR